MASAPPSKVDKQLITRIESVLETVPESRKYGLLIIAGEAVELARTPPAGGTQYMMVQLGNAAGSEAKQAPAAAVPFWQRPLFWKQMTETGLNCGGAVLAGIGAVGFTAAAPVTGGASLVGTAMTWAGGTAAALQCGVSVGKTVNELASDEPWQDKANAELGKSLSESTGITTGFIFMMKAADVIGILGAGMAIKDFVVATRAMRSAGLSMLSSTQQISRLTRDQNKLLSGLGVENKLWQRQAASRDYWSMAVLATTMLRKRVLDAFAAAMGLSGPFYVGGMPQDIVFAVVDFNQEVTKRRWSYERP